MRTMPTHSRWFIAAAVPILGCGGGSGGLGLTSPSLQMEATLSVAGSWSGTFAESHSNLKRDRTGQVQLSLEQSGSRVTGSGVSQGSICLPERYSVTGVVSGSSLSLSFQDGGDPAAIVSVDGGVSRDLLEAAYTSPRSGCDEIVGTLSLSRD